MSGTVQLSRVEITRSSHNIAQIFNKIISCNMNILALAAILTLLVGSHGQTRYNFWDKGGENIDSDDIDTDFILNVTDYRPTCGWMLKLTSTLNISDMKEESDYVHVQVDNYTFFLNSTANSGDLTFLDNQGYNIRVYGDFSNAIPDVCVYWYCVCDSSTGGVCQPVDQTLACTSEPGVMGGTGSSTDPSPPPEPPGTPQPTPSDSSSPQTASTTTTTTTTTAAATTTPTAKTTGLTTAPPLILVSPNASTTSSPTFPTPPAAIPPTRNYTGPRYLEHIEHMCYTGATYTTAPGAWSLLRCGALCLRDYACAAINFRLVNDGCDLIYANLDPGPLSMNDECMLYKAVHM